MLKYIILGIIQGVTEFLPLSSSGHLVIMQKVLGITGREIALSVVLHLGTALALVIFFFKDILNLLRNMRMLVLIMIVTLITGLIAIIGKDYFEKLFTQPQITSLALIVTGIILISTKKFMQAERETINVKDAFILGLVQGISIIPGISRSGITISALLFRKIDKSVCFQFSFLAAIPAVFGASILEAGKIVSAMQTECFNFSVGFMFSFLTGILSLWILRIIIQKAKLYYFGYYCILIAIITLLFIR